MTEIDFDYDIFVSYRRTGGQDAARQIVAEMKAKGIASDRIFFDFNSLRDGVFNEQIIEAIHGCKNFILVLSKCSMDRCVENGDWVAKEIRTALDSECKIIPVKINNEFESYPDDFPIDLKEGLGSLQITKLDTDDYFDVSIERIYSRLDLSDRKRTKHLETEEESLEDEEELSEEEKIINEYLDKAEELENGNDEHEPDYMSALELYQKAADMDSGYAWFCIGCYYHNGLGVLEDKKKAFECFTKSAELDCEEGKLEVAKCYVEGKGARTNIKRGLPILQSLADDGNAEAEDYLGDMYYFGIKVDVNLAEAFHHYSEASRLGSSYANVKLGKMYLFGEGIVSNYKKSEEYLTLAIKDDIDDAYYFMGLLLERKTHKKALEYFIEAKERGINEADVHITAHNDLIAKKDSSDFKFLIDGIFEISGRGVVATGSIVAGFIHVGDEVIITDEERSKEVHSVVTGVLVYRKLIDLGYLGDNVGLLLRGVSTKEDILFAKNIFTKVSIDKYFSNE